MLSQTEGSDSKLDQRKKCFVSHKTFLITNIVDHENPYEQYRSFSLQGHQPCLLLVLVSQWCTMTAPYLTGMHHICASSMYPSVVYEFCYITGRNQTKKKKKLLTHNFIIDNTVCQKKITCENH